MLLTRLRSQGGFTLVELLAAMGISMITLLMVLAVLDTSVKQSNAVAGRVNATQRARLALDRVTRQLRSQICISATEPAIVNGTGDAVTFYADLSDGVRPVEKRELVFDATAMTLSERIWPGVLNPVTKVLSWPGTPPSRQTLEGVTRRPVPPLPAPQDTAFFHYYAYSTATPPRPTELLTPPLTLTDRKRVAKIEMGFTTLPPNARGNPAAAVTLQNEIYVRVADPNDQAPTPTCV